MRKRRYTEEDMRRLPGLVIHDNGHSFDTPKGRVYFDNLHPLDECFGSELFGLLNITKAWKNVRAAGQEPRSIPIDKGLRQNVSKIEYDHKLVKHMTEERRDDPILLLVAADGTNVIDGTHRLKRRIRDKLPDVKIFLLRPDTLWDMRVRMYRKSGEKWELEVGLSDEQVAAQIESARFFERLLTSRT